MKKGEGIREIKNLLISLGAMSVMLGVALHFAPPQENQTIWEDITDEEVHTYIKQEEQTEDISVHTRIEEIETGTIEKTEEAAGQVNEFTYAEAQLLMRVAEAEAGNQGEDGMWLVMSVVMNRIKDPDFPDTLEDVIYKKYSFSSVWDGKIDEVELSAEVHNALARIESGEVAESIIGFELKDSTELDKYFAEAFTYRDHKFYTKKEKS